MYYSTTEMSGKGLERILELREELIQDSEKFKQIELQSSLLRLAALNALTLYGVNNSDNRLRPIVIAEVEEASDVGNHDQFTLTLRNSSIRKRGLVRLPAKQLVDIFGRPIEANRSTNIDIVHKDMNGKRIGEYSLTGSAFLTSCSGFDIDTSLRAKQITKVAVSIARAKPLRLR